MSGRLVSKVVGGIGNQLFCYAAARRLALKNDAELWLDLNFFRSDVNYRREYRLDSFDLPRHRTLRRRRVLPERVDHYLWRAARALGKRGLLPGEDWIVEARPGVFEAGLLTFALRRPTRMDGYWQDERYFADIAPVLRQDLRFLPSATARNRDLAERMAATASVAVHCRRQYGEAGLLEFDYYRKAIEAVAARIGQAEFYCFGDDPDWLASRWPRGLPFTVVHESAPGGEVDDLWLMSQCRHFVVANSTFSWWGAWLGAHPEKTVYAPRAKGLQYEVRSASGWLEIDW